MRLETPVSTTKLHILSFKVMKTVEKQAYSAMLLFSTKTTIIKSGYKVGIKLK